MTDRQEPPQLPPLPGPGISHVLEIPPDPETGGEWQLLVDRLRAWLGSGAPQSLWLSWRRPLLLLLALLTVLALMRVAGSLLAAVAAVPLLPGLLELTGLLWLLRFGLPQVLRSRDRNQLMAVLSQRWLAFRGPG